MVVEPSVGQPQNVSISSIEEFLPTASQEAQSLNLEDPTIQLV